MSDAPADLKRYWNQPGESLLAALRSSSAGLSAAEAGTRLTQLGPNSLEARKRATWPGLLLGQFNSPIILILLFATGVSAVL